MASDSFFASSRRIFLSMFSPFNSTLTSQSRALDSACTAAGAAVAYVLIPLLITVPFMVVYLFVQDVGKAVLYTTLGTLAAASGICVLAIILSWAFLLAKWSWKWIVTPIAEWCQERKDGREKEESP